MSGFRRRIVNALGSPLMAPVASSLSRAYGGLSTCLMYHRVDPRPLDPATSKSSAFHPNLILSVAAERFDRQMRHLRENCRVVSFPQAVRELRDGTRAGRSVSVTFDDGYRDNLKDALPILERHGVPATIYVTTGLIDRTMLLWWVELEFILKRASRVALDWEGSRIERECGTVEAKNSLFSELAGRFKRADRAGQRSLMDRLRAQVPESFSYDDQVLSWDEVRELDRHPLITIAAHTVDHSALIHASEASVLEEMRRSRERLERELGHSVPHFAYPFGSPAEAGARDFDLCREEGFETAVTTRAGHWHRGHREHLTALPRIMVEYYDDDEAFRFKLTGLDALLQQKGRRFVTA